MQTQDDHIGFEMVRCLQDCFTRQSELDGKFGFDRKLGALRRQLREPLEAGCASILSCLHEIARSGPTQPLRHRDHRDHTEQNELCSEMIRGRDSVGQRVQGSCGEVRSEQKRANRSSAPDWGILKRTRTDSQNKAFGTTKNLFRHRPEKQFPQTSPTVCPDDHHIHLLLSDYFLQLFPHITLEDNHLMTQSGQRPTLRKTVL